MTFKVYILYSPKYDKYYVGQTHDLDTRLKSHNTLGHKGFTGKYQPWKLKAYFELKTRAQAMKLEKYLKKKRRSFIARVISDPELKDYIVNKYV